MSKRRTPARTLSAIGSLILLPLVLTACSQSNDLAEPEISTQPATTTEASPEPEAEESEEPTPEPSTVTTVYETVEEEPPAPAKGPCTWQSMEDASPGEEFAGYCDGEWASGGIANSDGIFYWNWDGTDWVKIQADGHTYTGFNCYDVPKWEQAGAPTVITDDMTPCT